MMLSEALHSLYPNANPIVDYYIVDTGEGQALKFWDYDKLGPIPTQEELDAAPPLIRPTTLQAVGLCRFSGIPPVEVLENIALGPVARVAKGRYRASFNTPLSNAIYSVMPSVFDAAVRGIRVTAQTADYCEVRVTDTAGVAIDAQQIAIKIERVIIT